MSDPMANSEFSQMYFVTGKDLANFLFKGWSTNGQLSGLLGMCAAVLFATILLEALRTLMAFLTLRNAKTLNKIQSQKKLHPCKADYGIAEDDVEDFKLRNRLATHAILTVLQVISTGLAYLLMLAVMTFNVWIGVSVILGTLIGYFFFGALRDHMTFSQHMWEGENTPVDKRTEILSRSNVAFTGSSPEVHMDLVNEKPRCMCTCYCHLSR